MKKIFLSLLIATKTCSVFATELGVATGTGFLVSSECHIVTNHHVVAHSSEILVIDSAGAKLGAKVIAADPKLDLAVLQISSKGCKPLELVSSRNLQKGDSVHTLGFPRPLKQGRESKFTTGIVSSLSGVLGDDVMFQMTTPIQPGNSGGPVIEASGKVAGVVVSKLKSTEGDIPEGVNYAIKSDALIAFLKISDIEGFGVSSKRAKSKSLQNIAAEAENSVVMILSKTSVPASNGIRRIEFGSELGMWPRPTNAPKTADFSPSLKSQEYSGVRGTPVIAVADGTVVFAREGLVGYGLMVVIKHSSELMTVYGNNTQLRTSEGAVVKQGDVIAEMGSSLKFEVRRSAKAVDPETFFRQ